GVRGIVHCFEAGMPALLILRVAVLHQHVDVEADLRLAGSGRLLVSRDDDLAQAIQRLVFGGRKEARLVGGEVRRGRMLVLRRRLRGCRGGGKYPEKLASLHKMLQQTHTITLPVPARFDDFHTLSGLYSPINSWTIVSPG